MKKTLIALMALAGVAGANTTLSLANADITGSGNASITADADLYTADMTVALTLDVQKLRELLESSPESSKGYKIVNMVDTGKESTYTGVHIQATDSDYGLWGYWKNENLTYGAMDNAVNAFADLNGTAEGTGWDAVAYAGMVYTHSLPSSTNVSSTYAALTLCDAQGNVITSTYAAVDKLGSRDFDGCRFEFGDVVTASYFYGQAVTDETAMKGLAYTAAIPEPTTATLSLLALAGLAARRRRK